MGATSCSPRPSQCLLQCLEITGTQISELKCELERSISEEFCHVTALSEHSQFFSTEGDGSIGGRDVHHLWTQNLVGRRGVAASRKPSQGSSVCRAHHPWGGCYHWCSSTQMTGTMRHTLWWVREEKGGRSTGISSLHPKAI